MSEIKIRLTSRMERIIKYAEQEAIATGDNVIKPIHLLIACLHEKGGALGELLLKIDVDINVLRDQTQTFKNYQSIYSNYFDMAVDQEVIKVLEIAVSYMNRYNQIF